jgi:hypothetical protein
MDLMPIMVQFGVDGFPIDTTYWNTDVCAKGLFYLVRNSNKYFLFIPEGRYDILKEMDTAKSIVITRGNYNGKDDCFEVMFDDTSDNPYMIILQDEQFSRITSPLEEGWNGTFYIYSGKLEEYNRFFSYVYYRIEDNLPCLQPVEEQPGKLHNLTPLSKEEAILALKSGEYLVNGTKNYDVAHYHWYNDHILESDSYYDLSGEGNTIPEDELPQLYRIGDGSYGNLIDHIKAKVKPLFDSDKYPLLHTKFDLEKLTEQFLKICTKGKENNWKLNFEVIMNQLEKSLG